MKKYPKLSLILISFLTLFLELTFIRFLPANILSLAYFSNIVLISSFLGLGLGFLLVSKRDLFKYFPIILLAVVGLFLLCKQIEVIVPNLQTELLWSYYTTNILPFSGIEIGIMPMLVIVFVLNASIFVPIGQKTSMLMKNHPPLLAYTLDIVGSLVGIIVFSLISFFSWGHDLAAIWFAVAGIVSLYFLIEHKKFLLVGIACTLCIGGLVYATSRDQIWSPYYNIVITHSEENDSSLYVYVNRFLHQEMVDLTANIPALQKYDLPYVLKTPQNVLVLGAGTGNDVAVANMNGISHVDAVELDPAIAQIGRQLHPDHPYQNPNVTLYVDDARSFLKTHDTKYDMIVVGTLDSHALLSAMSTVRLDNFVYTTDSFAEIKNHLTPNGIVVLMFSVPQQWLGDKIIKTASTIFPEPIVYVGNSYLFNLMIIGGPGLPAILQTHDMSKLPFKQITNNNFPTENLPTDNWPYLYLFDHAISSYYLEAAAFLLIISFLGIILLSPKKMATWPGLNFFALGAGFLLLETKSITSLSLLFGSTWLVNAFVFGGILTMVLLANIFVSKVVVKKIEYMYLFLGLSLLLNFFLPSSSFLGFGFWIGSILSTICIALPIFFASILFSSNVKQTEDFTAFYGLNLMGAVLGGFLEYGSMITGLNFLYIIAGLIYLVSYAAFRKQSATDL